MAQHYMAERKFGLRYWKSLMLCHQCGSHTRDQVDGILWHVCPGHFPVSHYLLHETAVLTASKAAGPLVYIQNKKGEKYKEASGSSFTAVEQPTSQMPLI